MDITEFFDTNNIEHLKAYDHLRETGAWPEGFVPDDIIFNPVWHAILMSKMAGRWVDYKLGNS